MFRYSCKSVTWQVAGQVAVRPLSQSVHPLDMYHNLQVCKTNLPVHMRQKGSSAYSVSNQYGFSAPVSRLHGACELGQCLLGFGTSPVLRKKEMRSSRCSRTSQLTAICVTLAEMLAEWFPMFAVLLPWCLSMHIDFQQRASEEDKQACTEQQIAGVSSHEELLYIGEEAQWSAESW